LSGSSLDEGGGDQPSLSSPRGGGERLLETANFGHEFDAMTSPRVPARSGRSAGGSGRSLFESRGCAAGERAAASLARSGIDRRQPGSRVIGCRGKTAGRACVAARSRWPEFGRFGGDVKLKNVWIRGSARDVETDGDTGVRRMTPRL